MTYNTNITYLTNTFNNLLTLPTVLTLHCTYNTIITYTIADMICDTTVTTQLLLTIPLHLTLLILFIIL